MTPSPRPQRLAAVGVHRIVHAHDKNTPLAVVGAPGDLLLYFA